MIFVYIVFIRLLQSFMPNRFNIVVIFKTLYMYYYKVLDLTQFGRGTKFLQRIFYTLKFQGCNCKALK